MKTVLIIDGQGGGCGKNLVEQLKPQMPQGSRLLAVGTNSIATAAMLRAGADAAATGENPVRLNAARATVIAGPMGIVLADAMLGEVTPTMAQAVASSPAKRVLIPISRCDTFVAGVQEKPMGQYIEDAVKVICLILAEA